VSKSSDHYAKLYAAQQAAKGIAPDAEPPPARTKTRPKAKNTITGITRPLWPGSICERCEIKQKTGC